MVYNPPTVYDVRMPLQLNGARFGSIRVGNRPSVAQRSCTRAAPRGGLLLSAILLSDGGGRTLPLALGPLEQINRSLDRVTRRAEAVGEEEASQDEYGLVALKIAHLGRQMRDAREIFSALKDNVDQIMSNLQDGLMLFTRDARVVLVSASVESFLGRPRRELLGQAARGIFSPESAVGRAAVAGV